MPDSSSTTSTNTDQQVKRVFLVGHCGADGYGLKSMTSKVASNAGIDIELIMAGETGDLSDAAGETDLLLVNRVLGGFFETDSGIELIRNLNQVENPPRSILISNFPESQAEAEEAGALPGFGKRSLASPETHKLVTSLLKGELD